MAGITATRPSEGVAVGDEWGRPAMPVLRLPPSKDEVKRSIVTEFSKISESATNWALRVANCESGYNPYAKNGHSSATGIFQFMPRTFKGNGGQNIWDWHEQIEVAAKMIANHQEGQWECK